MKNFTNKIVALYTEYTAIVFVTSLIIPVLCTAAYVYFS